MKEMLNLVLDQNTEGGIPIPEMSFAFFSVIFAVLFIAALAIVKRSKILVPTTLMLGLLCIAPVAAATPVFEDPFDSFSTTEWYGKGKYNVTGGELKLHSGKIYSLDQYEANVTLLIKGKFATEQGKAYMGFVYNARYGAYFKQNYDDLTAITRESGASQEDTRMTIDAGVEREYEIRWSESFVTFLIDGEIVATHTEVIPYRNPLSIGLICTNEAEIEIDLLEVYEGAEATPGEDEDEEPEVYEDFADGIDAFKWATNNDNSIWGDENGVIKVQHGDMMSVDSWIYASRVNLTMRIAFEFVSPDATWYEQNEFFGFGTWKNLEFGPDAGRLEVVSDRNPIGAICFVTAYDESTGKTGIYAYTGKKSQLGDYTWGLFMGPWYIEDPNDFHIYTIIWEETGYKDTVEFYIDGAIVKHFESNKIIPDKPSNFIFGARSSSWIKCDWVNVTLED